MRRLVTDDKERVNTWLYQKIGRETPFYPPRSFQAVGVVDENDKLVAGVIFESFATGARCSMHCAGEGKNWCTRELLTVCFEYVFNTAKCKVILNTVSANNAKSLKFTKHIGFTEIGRVRDGAGDCDLVLLELHRDDCRWIGDANV